jgi:hypothetical protein
MSKKLKGVHVAVVPEVPKRSAISATEGRLRLRIFEDQQIIEARVAACYTENGADHVVQIGPAIEIKSVDYAALQAEIDALMDKIWDYLKNQNKVDF